MTGVPEADLWASVIQQALTDLSNPRYRREAEDWLNSQELEPGSFLFICDALGLDPGKIRTLAWQSKRMAA
ncbi:MAG: hypothetical protein HQL80_13680 [Magnetococcales bacterium]|nr:hypothetical protein [Magnetococcales bacterium]